MAIEIVDFPIKHEIFHSYIKLPEGKPYQHHIKRAAFFTPPDLIVDRFSEIRAAVQPFVVLHHSGGLAGPAGHTGGWFQAFLIFIPGIVFEIVKQCK